MSSEEKAVGDKMARLTVWSGRTGGLAGTQDKLWGKFKVNVKYIPGLFLTFPRVS